MNCKQCLGLQHQWLSDCLPLQGCDGSDEEGGLLVELTKYKIFVFNAHRTCEERDIRSPFEVTAFLNILEAN